MAEKKYEIHRVKDEDRFRVGMELTHGLRKVDGREMELAGVEPPLGCMESVMRTPDVWAAREKKGGGLIAVWGIKEVTLEEAMELVSVKGLSYGEMFRGRDAIQELAGGRLVWCLGTQLIKAHKMAFAMESKRILSRWARKYGVLWNYVASFNQDALAWLEWCGAEFFELPAWKGRKERFVRFEIRGGE